MPDIACPYTLSTSGGTINFNDGSATQFYIQSVLGLGTAPMRLTIDDVGYGDNQVGYNWWKSGRHVTVEGVFLVDPVLCSTDLVEAWNDMEEDLRVALQSIAGLMTATGTLSWTPAGLSARSLTVRHDVPLECQPDQNFMLRAFTFGLFAENPDWT